MSRFSLFRWGKSKSDSEGKSRATGADRFVADDIDRKKNPGQKNSADDPQLPQKKRARRRLVGSITLVLAAIIVLPMIFESEPRPVSPNLLIDIPSKDNKPVQVAAANRLRHLLRQLKRRLPLQPIRHNKPNRHKLLPPRQRALHRPHSLPLLRSNRLRRYRALPNSI